MASTHFGLHVSVEGISRPSQIRQLKPLLDRSRMPVVLEVDFRPIACRNSVTGVMTLSWPMPIQIRSVVSNPHRRVSFDLRFGSDGAQLHSVRSVRRLLLVCGHQVSGVTWRGRPTLSQMLDIAIEFPAVRQALRLQEDELAVARYQPDKFRQLLRKWSKVGGITDLVIPAGDATSPGNVREVLNAIRLIKAEDSFGIRLQSPDQTNQRIWSKLLVRHGVECGQILPYDQAKAAVGLIEQAVASERR